MDSHKRNQYLFRGLSFLFLLVCFFGTVQFVRLKVYYTLNADDSSELLLGNILASEKKLVTKSWYYSTELEILNTNIFFSLPFYFTNNWHRARIIATVSMYLILLLNLYGMSRVFHFRELFALSAAVLFIPFSDVYYIYILKAAYYFPLITISFFTLILAELFLRAEARKQYCLLGFSFLFSLLVGMGGMRQMFMTYIPLLAASVILFYMTCKKAEYRKWLVFSGISFLGSVIGYGINAGILSKIFSFRNWDDINFVRFDFTRLSEIINGFLDTFGFSTDNIFSAAIIKNLACGGWILVTIAAICYAVKKREKVSSEFLRLALFVGCSYGIFVLFYLFTNMIHQPHYNIPIVCVSFSLAALFIKQVDWKKYISMGVFSMLVILTAASGISYYVSNWNHNQNEEIRQISDFLLSEGYYNGYSTFWSANNITEFTNGKIEVWDLGEGLHDQGLLLFEIWDVDQVYEWLQKVSHSTTHPTGKVYLLLTAGEFQKNNWGENLKEEKIIYRSPKFVILGYEDYEDLVNNLYPGYEFTFGNNDWLTNGADIDGHRELYYAGVSSGPYKTFWPGDYEITAEGRNLSDSEVFCIANSGAQVFEVIPVRRDENSMIYNVKFADKISDVEVIVRNMSDEEDSVVELDSLRILKITDTK